jgi:hypothetical protein
LVSVRVGNHMEINYQYLLSLNTSNHTPCSSAFWVCRRSHVHNSGKHPDAWAPLLPRAVAMQPVVTPLLELRAPLALSYQAQVEQAVLAEPKVVRAWNSSEPKVVRASESLEPVEGLAALKLPRAVVMQVEVERSVANRQMAWQALAPDSWAWGTHRNHLP